MITVKETLTGETRIIPGTLEDEILFFFYNHPDGQYSAHQVASMCDTKATEKTVLAHLRHLAELGLVEFTNNGKFAASEN